jgi:hypothetical protein
MFESAASAAPLHYALKPALPALLGTPLPFQLRLPLPQLFTLSGGVAGPHACGDIPQAVVNALARGCVPDLVLLARSTLTRCRSARGL